MDRGVVEITGSLSADIVVIVVYRSCDKLHDTRRRVFLGTEVWFLKAAGLQAEQGYRRECGCEYIY